MQFARHHARSFFARGSVFLRSSSRFRWIHSTDAAPARSFAAMTTAPEIAEGLADLAVPIDQLDSLEGNPRRGDVEAVAKSYARFGQRKPIVARRKVDGRAEVTAGNTQLAAARQLGWQSIAVVWVDDDDDTARAWALADNRTSDLGLYDPAALAAYLESVKLVGDEELLAATGYTTADVAEILARERRSRLAVDLIPEPPATPVSAPGDVWTLGESRLVVGDCTDPDVVATALAGEQPTLLVTDPPYGVQLDPRWRDGVYDKVHPESHHYMIEAHGNRTMSNDTRADWSEAFELVPSLRMAYVWHGGARRGIDVALGLERIGFRLVSEIIWDKGHYAMSRSLYHWEHEACWVAQRGKALPFIGDKRQSTVWRAGSPKQLAMHTDEEKWDHPAQKPIAIMEPSIVNHLKAGGLVYEPFSGSGTTLMAAVSNGRRCIAVELDPRYADVSLLRWQRFAGELPVREGEAVDLEPADA